MDKYYQKVPADLVDQLLRFRQEHPLSHVEANRLSWDYLATPQSAGTPVLIFPGALGTSDSAWRTISLFEEASYRVICPEYPAVVSSMGELADGAAAILDREGLQEVFVVGGSYGGMLAQVFVHRHPQRVSRLVLSHTYPPVSKRTSRVQPALRIFRVLPMGMVRRMLRERMTGTLPPDASPQLLLIAGMIHETLDTRFTRQAALNTYQRMMDFDQQVFTPQDLADWQGRVLVMLAEDDPTTPEPLRQELLALYPGASLHMFQGNSHATSTLESEEYFRVMDEFFRMRM